MAERVPGNGLELALRAQRSDWRDSKLAAQAESWAGLLAPLALAMPAIAPPPRLGDRIARAVDQAEADLSQTFEERLEEGSWREIGPGIEVKPLWDDKTFLIRCAPGAVYPGTPDRLFEHCVILHGDMRVDDEILEAGDYRRTDGETTRGAFTSRTGLLLLARFR